MAFKKFLMENGKQVWPITRADCVYTVGGDELLSTVVDKIAQDLLDEVERAKAAEKANADEIVNMKNADLDGSLANKIAANDAAIKAEATARENAVQGVQDQLNALAGDGEGSVADQIAEAKTELEGQIDDVEQALADEKNAAKEGSLAKQIADEKARAEGVEAGFETRIAANEAFVAAQPAKDQAQDGRLDALEGAVGKAATETEPATGMQLKIAQNAKAVEDLKTTHDNEMDAVEGRVADLEAKFEGEQSVDAKIAAAEQAAKDHADDLDEAMDARMKVFEAGGAQDVADKEVRLAAAEGEIDTLQEFVNAHSHEAMEQGIADNKADIETLNGDANTAGSVAKAVKDAVDAEAGLREEADNDLGERIAAFEANGANDVAALAGRVAANEVFVAAQPAVDKAQDDRIKALEDDAPVKQAAIEAAQADADALEQRLDAEGGLVDRIEANETNIARLDGAVDVEGSVKKQIKDAIDTVNGNAEALEGRVAANEAAIGVINGTGEGSIKKAVADLVDGAPEALDTLNELAAALRDNAGVLDAVEQAFDNKLATLQADVDQNEADCDAAIATEKQRAEGQEAAIRQELANEKAALQAEIDADVKAEADLRVAADNAINAEIANMKNADLDGSLANLIAALQAQLGAHLTTAEYDGVEYKDDLQPLD